MNLARLAAIQASLAQIAEELAREVETAQASKDELVTHIYQARRRYRTALRHDTKGGRKTDTCLLVTLQHARLLGYQGGAREWHTLISAEAKPKLD